jgi:hypothetical protein
MTDAERIAAGLTKAQKRTLLNLLDAEWKQTSVLTAKGLIVSVKYKHPTTGRYWRVRRDITPLGLAVRAILQQQIATTDEIDPDRGDNSSGETR